MAGWLRRLFGSEVERQRNDMPGMVQTGPDSWTTAPDPLWDKYMGLVAGIKAASMKNDFDRVLDQCKKIWPLLPQLHLQEDFANDRDYCFDGVSDAAKVYAIREDLTGLDQISYMLKRAPVLTRYGREVRAEYKTLQEIAAIRRAVEKNPGIKQTEVKKHVRDIDGRRVAKLSALMERHGRLRREKVGKSYRLSSSSS